MASRTLHLFTSEAVSRLLAVIEWCSKMRCITNGCRYSAPLTAVRSVHWFRRCALSPVFCWSHLVYSFNTRNHLDLHLPSTHLTVVQRSCCTLAPKFLITCLHKSKVILRTYEISRKYLKIISSNILYTVWRNIIT